MTTSSPMSGELELGLCVVLPQVTHRNSDPLQAKEEFHPTLATQTCGLAGGHLSQLVELGGEEESGLPGKLVGGKTQAQQDLVAVLDGQCPLHRSPLPLVVYDSRPRPLYEEAVRLESPP